MKMYSIKEVSKKLNLSIRKMKEWEKLLEGTLHIPRTEAGARYYEEKEMELLLFINEAFSNDVKIDEIKAQLALLQDATNVTENEEQEEVAEEIVAKEETTEPISPSELITKEEFVALTESKRQPELLEQNMQLFFETLDVYKQNFLSDMRAEIQNGVQQEIEVVKNEIQSGSVHIVEKLSASIRHVNEETQNKLSTITDDMQTTKQTTEQGFEQLHSNLTEIKEQSQEETEKLTSHIQTVTTSSNEMKSMMDGINASQSHLTKQMEILHQNDHALLASIKMEREKLNQDIRKREENFQDLVQGFRQTAAATTEKQKKRWKFWKQ